MDKMITGYYEITAQTEAEQLRLAISASCSVLSEIVILCYPSLFLPIPNLNLNF